MAQASAGYNLSGLGVRREGLIQGSPSGKELLARVSQKKLAFISREPLTRYGYEDLPLQYCGACVSAESMYQGGSFPY
jgi:hypothetical protein